MARKSFPVATASASIPLKIPLLGVTAHGAQALGDTQSGRITAGQDANLCVWNAAHPAELAYRIGFNPLHTRIFKGSL